MKKLAPDREEETGVRQGGVGVPCTRARKAKMRMRMKRRLISNFLSNGYAKMKRWRLSVDGNPFHVAEKTVDEIKVIFFF